MKKISLYVLIAVLMAGIAIICFHGTKSEGACPDCGVADVAMAQAPRVDTLIFVSEAEVDSIPFILLKMNPETAVVTFADAVIPSLNDSSVALCVEAAFNGQLLKEFQSSNVSGDYMIDGVLHKGYRTPVNTGFLATVDGVPFISSVSDYRQWLNETHSNTTCMFHQVLLVKDGQYVYSGRPIKPTSRNIYRAACILDDGSFVVIQSKAVVQLRQFILSLMQLGVSDALYLDMGGGWNYGWYRETTQSMSVELFKNKTPYQTNWLVVKAKDSVIK